jgi:hypothetical protein
MRGYEDYNFPAFDAAERHLREQGHAPVNPAAMDRLFEGWGAAPPKGMIATREDRKRFILRDLVALMECDAIYLLDGWQDSTGATVEVALAEFLGLELIEEVLEGWHSEAAPVDPFAWMDNM